MPFLIKRSLLIIFCLLCACTRHAGFDALAAEPVTSAQWQKLTDDKALGYKNDRETVKSPAESRDGSLLRKVLQSIYNFLVAARLLIWVLIIAAILYFIYRAYLSNGSFMFGKNKKIMAEAIPAQAEEEDIATTNWEGLLQQAINNKDLRLAVRYRYMWLLQILQRRELIQYRSDKTNYEYYTELSETNFKQPFKQLSRQYEYAWYGHFALSTAAYAEYSDLFNNLRKQLGA